MTGRSRAERASLCLVALVIICLTASDVRGEPEPMPPGIIYTDNFAEDSESLMLLHRLKQLTERKQEMIEQERELTEEQMAIRAMLEAKARDHRLSQEEYSAEDAEVLPAPSAIVHPGGVHSGKRTGYISLCHFKICNMGRKRQL